MATIFLIWFVVFYTNFRPRGFLVAMSAWFAVITVLNLLPPRGRFFISSFGLYLLIMTLSSVGNNGINAQIANILPNVYGMDERTTSALISLAGLLNIGLFIVAGRWMARSGA